MRYGILGQLAQKSMYVTLYGIKIGTCTTSEIMLMGTDANSWEAPLSILQLTLVISNSLISNNRLSRSENLVPAKTWKSNKSKKYCGKEEKLLLRSNISFFSQYFRCTRISNIKSPITYKFVKCGCSNNFFPQFWKSDMSRYGYPEVFQRVLGFRESTVFCLSYKNDLL